jgi:WD40 repeat protein
LLTSISTTPGILCCWLEERATTDSGWDVLCGFKDGNLRGWHVHIAPPPTEVEDGSILPLITTCQVEPMTSILSSMGDWITCIHRDSLSDVVVAGSWDGRIRIWDLRKGLLKRTVVSGTGTRSAVLGLSVVGNAMVVGCYDGTIVVHEFGRAANYV